jgi:murein DD-endopeptidase MepM/ murein hydrolase activator NlpD
MIGKTLSGSIAAILTVVACLAGATLLVSGGATACTMPAPGGTTTVSIPPSGGWRPIGHFDTEQVGHTATIIAVGADVGVPIRGWIIAVATALQESGLRNLPGGDRDSIGLFQQRPSQGWGTPGQLADPTYASHRFYAKLLAVPGWQTMAVTEAAQEVQRSAYPEAYAKHEADATLLVNTVGSDFKRAMLGRFEQCVSNSGWALPAVGAVVSGWRTPSRPGHAGVDIGAPRGGTIRAAATGIVIAVRCNVSAGSCDIDGSPSIKGCGHYAEIAHGQGVTTRYCHQLRRPAVNVGQAVAAGQPIGVVGSSGNSSGPHLHFEVRINGVDTDPVRYLTERGIHIGPRG